MSLLRKHWPFAVLALLPLVPLWRAVFLGEAIGPFDQILQMAPWNLAPLPGRSWDVLQADGVLQFWVWRGLVLEGWANFDAPFWNPYQLMGTPLLANSQSGALYPLHILFGILHIPVKAAVTLLAWIHLGLAGIGSYKLTRQLGGVKEGAVFAGAVVALSPLLVSWAPLASVITTLAWLPWLLLWTLRTAESSSWRSAFKPAAWMGACGALMILAGHLQFAAYGFMAAVLTGVLALLVRRKPEVSVLASASSLVLGLVLAGCLSAPQLLPVLSFSKHSHRGGVASEDGYQAYLGGALKPFEALGTAYPAVNGLPGQSFVTEEGASPAFWPAYVKRGANFAESALAIGPLALVLLFYGWRRRKDAGHWIMAGGAALGLAIAFGTPLNRLLYFGVPGWSSTGSPGRAICLFVFCAAVLAGLMWPKAKEDTPKPLLAIGGTAALLMLSMVIPMTQAAAFGSWIPGFDPSAIISSTALGAAPMACLAAAAACGAIWLIYTGRSRDALILAIACQILVFSPTALLTSKTVFQKTESDPQVRIAAVNADWHLLTPANAIYPPNTAAASGLRDVGGYDSLLHKETVEHLRAVNGQDPAPEANGNIMHIKPGFNAQLLADSGVSKVLSQRPIQGLIADKSTPYYEYSLPTEGRAFTSAGPATIERDGFSGMTVSSSTGGELIVRDRLMEGWTAKIDGEAVEIEPEGPFRKVTLPNGGGTVEFSYTPPGLIRGLQLFLLGLLVILAAGISSRLGRKTNSYEKEA